MPQTVEAINHAKDAKVPIVVAVNKVDKPEANPDKVMTQLSEYGLTPEECSIANPFVYPKAAFAQMFYPEFQKTSGQLKAFIELHSDTLYAVNEHWETYPYATIGIGKFQPYITYMISNLEDDEDEYVDAD